MSESVLHMPIGHYKANGRLDKLSLDNGRLDMLSLDNHFSLSDYMGNGI